MRIYIIACLLCAVAFAEKKINLDDIERDNLRSEGKVENETIQPQETKYSVKPEVNRQQEYQQKGNQYETVNNQATGYTGVQQTSDIKYTVKPEDYNQEAKYSGNDGIYQAQNTILPSSQQNTLPLQYYTGYQQSDVGQKIVSSPQAAYEQQQFYQPEVVVGNQIQSVQQKAATERYVQDANKDTLYVDIPTNQLLSYYPNLAINQVSAAKSQVQPLLHRLATEAAQKVSIPVYGPALAQNQLNGPAYQIRSQYVTYAPKYPQHTQALFSNKASQSQVYATNPFTQKVYSAPQAYTTALYSQPEQQAYSQPTKFAYTNAYFTQPQTQYQLVYTQPGAVYSQGTPIYSNLHAQAPAYVQDNGLGYSQPNQYNQYSHYTQPQQFYIPSSVSEQLTKNILYQSNQQNVHQNYAKIPEAPRSNLALPQLPAQNFKDHVTQLSAVPERTDNSYVVKSHHELSAQPKSLLDSYTPSHIIIAQDAARYRERPIKLESGFLPSKGSYSTSYKKRKSE
ncbi:uncharacterized protein LOC107266813 isoform X2 [Cephus cinctus]|uniref:Uncharacterized protein LOC107266813 isoform X1 n=1 Tax=Cephus cinctus TaxID=211228 RepID=A0AAJ7BS97_CEPCN|nr:uncharacterized protein LOC107266813 isoform X1 [Cephus cinctus]XP_015593188.1 uncharacterized protein LOC107266813 isoform X2 [Cephus cinctus]